MITMLYQYNQRLYSSVRISSTTQSRYRWIRSLFVMLLMLLPGLAATSRAQTTKTWTGSISSDWNTAANWSATIIPGAGDDVVIPSGTANNPVLSTTAVANSVEVQSGASFTISSAGSLSVAGSNLTVFSPSSFLNDGTVVNQGRLTLTDNPIITTIALINKGLFKNLTGGIITIDVLNINSTGFSNTGNFINEAAIRLGIIAYAGRNGLTNTGSFSNVAGGNVAIDNTVDIALLNTPDNSSGTFINSATITIGSSSNRVSTATGLQNGGVFTNLSGGLITIDKTSEKGLRNLSGFTNEATINVGATGATGVYGISNEISSTATFSNTNGGKITIDRAGTAGLNNLQGKFINAAAMSIGSQVTGAAILNSGTFDNQGCPALLTSSGNVPITNTSSFSNTGAIIESFTGTSGISYNGGLIQNLNGGSFTIASGNPVINSIGLIWRGCVSSDWNTASNWLTGSLPTDNDDVVIPSGTANNPVLSTTAVANSVEVQSGASFTISSAGSLSINGSKTISGNTNGFYNAGSVINQGQLILGNTGSVGNYGLYNTASFSNATGGIIQIDNSGGFALYNYSGSFFNSATIKIGSLAGVGSRGLRNQNRASFSNTNGGFIQIDRSGSFALDNEGDFINSATIKIGSLAGVGLAGLYNTSSFKSTDGGIIQIDRSNTYAIENRGDFVNSATIKIGSLADVAQPGLYNFWSFSNTGGGVIQIDNASTDGIQNAYGSFINSATILIGGKVALKAISNLSTFNNQGCAALINSQSNAAITNSQSFSNTGTIIESSTGTSGISYNGGLIQNLNGGTFTVGSGNPPLSLSATDPTTCNPANGSFTLTGVQPGTAYTLSYTLGTATASISQTGNAAGQLTAANLSAGTYALALSGSCVAQTLPLSATLNGPTAFTITSQPAATSVVCAGKSVSAGVGVSGTTGPVTYQWYKNSLASPVASQTAATLSLTNLTAAESGSYSVVITDNCTSATSAALSLTGERNKQLRRFVGYGLPRPERKSHRQRLHRNHTMVYRCFNGPDHVDRR